MLNGEPPRNVPEDLLNVMTKDTYTAVYYFILFYYFICMYLYSTNSINKLVVQFVY